MPSGFFHTHKNPQMFWSLIIWFGPLWVSCFHEQKKTVYPTAFKGCAGIVFTHGIRLGRWVAGGNNNFVQAVSQKL